MVRVAIAAIVALAIGGLGGALLARRHYEPLVDELAGNVAEANTKVSDLMRRHETELREVQARADEMNRQLAALQQRAAADAAQPIPAPVIDPLAALEALPAPAPRAEAAPREQEGAMDEGGRDRWRRGDDDEEDDGSRDERRRAFMGEMRDRMDSFFADRLAQSTNPQEQSRLVALQEQIDYAMELRQQMRDAQNDEERAAYGDALRQTGDSIRTLVEEQQDFQLRDMASRFGITDPQKQQEFATGVRELRSDPYFRMPFGFYGPFMGGPGGGPGGFGPGGPGDAGNP